MLQEGHISDRAPAVMQVTRWGSSSRIRNNILSQGASTKGRNSNSIDGSVKLGNWVCKTEPTNKKMVYPFPAHTCLYQCHEPGSVSSAGGHRKELREWLQLFI